MKRVTPDSLVPGMQVRNKKLKQVGTVRGQVHNPAELARAKEGFVSVLVPQEREGCPHRVCLWNIRDLVHT